MNTMPLQVCVNDKGTVAWFWPLDWVRGATLGSFIRDDDVEEEMGISMLCSRIDGAFRSDQINVASPFWEEQA